MEPITEDVVTRLIDTLRAQYPTLSLRTKSSLLPGSTRCTTLGTVIYVSPTWPHLTPEERYLRLTHEALHLAQFAQYGTAGYLWRYALPSWRWAWEWPAYEAEMRACAQVYSVGTLLARRAQYIDQMAGRSYYWMASEATITAAVDALLGVLATQAAGA